MHRISLALLVAATAAAAALAGCGGDDDDAQDKPLTQAQFVARADTVCREVKQAQQAYSDRLAALPGGSDLERVAPILAGVVAESRKGRARLGALRGQAPSADRPAFDAYLSAADRLLAASTRLAEAARSGDRAAARRVAGAEDALSTEQQRRAGASGLKDCGDVF